VTLAQAIAAFLAAVIEAIKPYIPTFGGILAGVKWQQTEQQETDLDAYRQRQKDEREIGGLSDDALDRELRDPPH